MSWNDIILRQVDDLMSLNSVFKDIHGNVLNDHGHGFYTNVDGDKVWFCHGKYHREDGPAVEFVSGYKAWYSHGKLHREDGHAMECVGYKFWYFNGKHIDCSSQEEFEIFLRFKAFW